jgi:hypothetical protein
MKPRIVRHFGSLAIVAVLTSFAHADAPNGRYVVSASTVYDSKTKLTWQRTIASSDSCPYTYANAKAYCSTIGTSLGGTGWRLPTLKELLTLIDWAQTNQGFDTTAFPTQANCYYWSATLLPGQTPERRWTIRPSGSILSTPIDQVGTAMCVR